MDFLQSLYVVVLLAGVTVARDAYFTQCEGSEDTCNITRVEISPCRNRYSCYFTLESESDVTVHFTPKFSASDVKMGVYTDIEFLRKESTICKNSECLTSGVEYKISKTVKPDWIILPNKYDITWKLWDKNDRSRQCCLNMQVEVGW